MSEYSTIKIPDEKIENLKIALRKKGLNPRSNAEAVNILIDNFILNADLRNISDSNQESKIST